MIIKFDDIVIDENAYAGLDKKSSLFDGAFKLGTSICETYNLTLNKEFVSDIPKIVTIYEEDILIKTLLVDDYKEEDLFVKLELIDYMVNFNFPYDASQIMKKE